MPRQRKTTPNSSDSGQKVDKAAKFSEIAPKRVVKVLDAMDVLGNVFNRQNYTYSDEQVEKIFTALDAKVQELRALTQPGSGKSGNAFTL